MPSPSKLSEFQDLLRRLFQVESAQELNFDICRIINKYERGNASDFFIHKDFASFLNIAKWLQIDYEKERNYLKTLNFLCVKKICTNSDSKIREATLLSPIFIKLMFAKAK
ncbi:MAG: hypothetical protein ACNYPH_03910 [Gammaproteobacteria bacterium WSBS_2016_MAG_OTU1]